MESAAYREGATAADALEQVELLQKELALRKQEYERNVASLQAKLDWYIENQRLIDEQDGHIRQLQHELSDSKRELESVRSLHRRQDIRRIQELETRLVEIETAMRKRHPDSLVNLILASRRADEESKIAAMEAATKEKINAMEREMEAMHESHEKKLASFRQQQDRLLLQYQRKIRDQDLRLAERGGGRQAGRSARRQPPSDGAANGGDEAEAERVRRFYTDKIKELERRWGAKYQALKKQQYSTLDHAAADQKKSAVSDGKESQAEGDTAVVIAQLRRKIRDLREENKEIRATLAGQDAMGSHQASEHCGVDEQSEQANELAKQLQASEDARAHLIKTLAAVQSVSTALPAQSPESADKSQCLAQLRDEVRRDLMDEHRRDVEAQVFRLETQLSTASEQFAARAVEWGAERKQLQEHVDRLKGEKEELQHRLALADSLHEQLAQAAKRVMSLEHEVMTWRRRAEVPQTPSMLQYRGLELKVETLTQKHEMREAELRVLLEQAMMSSHLARLQRERVHRDAIAAKNAEISVFKQQLGEILEELALLQPGMAPAPSAFTPVRATAEMSRTSALSSPSPPSPSRYPHARSRYS